MVWRCPCDCSGEGPPLPGSPHSSEAFVFKGRACAFAAAYWLLLPGPELLFLERSLYFCCCSCAEVVLWRITLGILDFLPEETYSARSAGSADV